jgi:hypothetical protein
VLLLCFRSAKVTQVSGCDADDEDSVGNGGHGNPGRAAAAVGEENGGGMLFAPDEALR